MLFCGTGSRTGSTMDKALLYDVLSNVYSNHHAICNGLAAIANRNANSDRGLRAFDTKMSSSRGVTGARI